jgi:hypothetical protein
MGAKKAKAVSRRDEYIKQFSEIMERRGIRVGVSSLWTAAVLPGHPCDQQKRVEKVTTTRATRAGARAGRKNNSDAS